MRELETLPFTVQMDRTIFEACCLQSAGPGESGYDDLERQGNNSLFIPQFCSKLFLHIGVIYRVTCPALCPCIMVNKKKDAYVYLRAVNSYITGTFIV